MTILWMDGPDHYGTDVSALTDGAYAEAFAVGLEANAGPGGVGGAFQFYSSGSNLGCYLRKVLPGNRNLVALGFRIYRFGLPTSSVCIAQWRDASNITLARLLMTSTGALTLEVNGVAIVTTAPVIVSSSWQHIECRLKIGASGSYQINVNGLPVASSDSQSFPTTQIAQVTLNNVSAFGGGTVGQHKIRDYYIWDDQGTLNNGGMQGDRQVITSMPNGDGATQDWGYSSGTQGYPLIDEIPPDDAGFVYANAAGNKSTFDTADISTDITSISAVRIAARAAKSDAGIGTFALNMVSSGDTAEGTEQALSTEFIYYNQIVEQDPHTGTKWTAANLNAAQVELERVQ